MCFGLAKVLRWQDPQPEECTVKYIGLTSWSAPVQYRSAAFMCLRQNHTYVSLKCPSCSHHSNIQVLPMLDEYATPNSANYPAKHLVNNMQFADVLLVCRGGGRVLAHAALLVCASDRYWVAGFVLLGSTLWTGNWVVVYDTAERRFEVCA